MNDIKKQETITRFMFLPKSIRWSMFGVGLVILSIGLAITIVTKEFGVYPWDVLHLGLMNYLPLSYGTISMIVGIVSVLVSYWLGVKPQIGTILNMVLVAQMTNLFIKFLPLPSFLWLKVLYYIFGITILGAGTALYVAANLGTGPRDSFMLALCQRFGISVGWARTITELLAVGIGFMLSGPVGIGTIVFSLSIGFFVEIFLRGYVGLFEFFQRDSEKNEINSKCN